MSFRGFILSTALHGGVAFGLVMGWPYLQRAEPRVVPVIPIELLTEAQIADEVSVPEMVRAEEPAPVEEPPAAEPEPEPEAAPPEPEPETEPALDPDPIPPPPAEEEPEPEAPAPEPEPEPEPEPAPTPPRRESAPDPLAGLDDALKDLDPDKEEARRPREVPAGTATGLVDAERVGTGDTLTASEEALVQSKIYQCWNRQTGVPDIEKLVVTVQFELNPDGTISGAPRVVNDAQINRSGNRFWVAARARAVSAVTDCAPYDFLPVERYETWRRMTLNFTPPAE